MESKPQTKINLKIELENADTGITHTERLEIFTEDQIVACDNSLKALKRAMEAIGAYEPRK